MTEGTIPTSRTTLTFDQVLEFAQQLDLTDRARLVTRLAADMELSLVQNRQTQPTPSSQERINRIRAAQQKYGHLLTPSDEFARRKQQEIDLEERQP